MRSALLTAIASLRRRSRSPINSSRRHGLVGEVGDEDAGHCLGVLVDGTDEQPRLTVGRGDRDRLADL
ncbi:hypothetical protein ACFQJ5_16875 [Halomicroarcula sp. GCM10025324]|uniref:hypothetical protein n=1 Tax=Haloarcula TaxID=2237 RepID=UPI0023E78962|nr:hypothetical protein [Halomicroarcula sp. ZS-22-S1]